MFLVRICWVVLLSSIIQGFQLLEVDRKDEKVSSLVKSILEDLNSRESDTHDVALLRLEFDEAAKHRVNDVSEALIKAFPNKNLVITPSLGEQLENCDIREATVVIIVSDINDGVSKIIFKS